MSLYVQRNVDIDHRKLIDFHRIKTIISICHCSSLTTDMESYVTIDAHPECIDRMHNDVLLYLSTCEDLP